MPAVVEPLDAEPAIDLLMRDFNSRFAIVAEGGYTGVVRFAFNADLNRYTPVTMTLESVPPVVWQPIREGAT